MASYDGATLKVTELFSKGHSTANICLWRLHSCFLDFIHLSAMCVAEIAKSTNLKGCPHTFVYVVCVEGIGAHQSPVCLFDHQSDLSSLNSKTLCAVKVDHQHVATYSTGSRATFNHEDCTQPSSLGRTFTPHLQAYVMQILSRALCIKRLRVVLLILGSVLPFR